MEAAILGRKERVRNILLIKKKENGSDPNKTCYVVLLPRIIVHEAIYKAKDLGNG
jgi:hypothetical protein